MKKHDAARPIASRLIRTHPRHSRLGLIHVLVIACALSACARGMGEPSPAATTSRQTAARPTVATVASAGEVAPLVALAQAAAAPKPAWQTITLHRNGASGTQVAVTLAIPFPPGALTDADRVHVLDENGQIIASHVEPALRWHVQPGGIRAVRVQFHATLADDQRSLRFVVGEPVSRRPDGWPYADGEIVNANGVLVPGVLATLSPQWMSASMIAGPQQPAVPPRAYDRYVATQFQWAKPLPADNPAAWLFDRPTTLFQQYVRTGRVDYLAAAVESYHFYMSHIKRHATPGWPECGGGFQLLGKSPCDPKYGYVEPILLALGLTGDDSMHDQALIKLMIAEWDLGGWNFPAGPYTRPDQSFTEREAGLGLLATVSAWEITGDSDYLDSIHDRVGWLYAHQQHNPDGLGNDGSWRSSWQVHEGDDYNAATDIRGNSPWMSQNIIDALWHAWLATGDSRIPTMIVDYGRYMENHGWIDLDQMARLGKDWRNPCSGPKGQISWYWSSSQASLQQLARIQDSEGWYSDAHNVELMLVVAAARYFATDAELRAALGHRLKLLKSSYAPACARNSNTPRRFNWNNRGVGVVQWFMARPPRRMHRTSRPPRRPIRPQHPVRHLR